MQNAAFGVEVDDDGAVEVAVTQPGVAPDAAGESSEIWVGRVFVLNASRQALAAAEPGFQDVVRLIFGYDPAVSAHCLGALAQWLAGYPDKAIRGGTAGAGMTRSRIEDLIREARREPVLRDTLYRPVGK